MKRLGFTSLVFSTIMWSQVGPVSICGTPADPGSTPTLSLSVTCSPQAGQTVLLFGLTAGGVTQSVSDGGVGNTISPANAPGGALFPNVRSTTMSAEYNIWIIPSAIAQQTTFTVLNSVSSPYSAFIGLIVSGVNLSSPLDCGAWIMSTSVAWTLNSGTCTTSVAGDLLVGFGNQQMVGGMFATNATAQPFRSVGSGAALEYGFASTPGPNSLSFTALIGQADMFMLAIRPVTPGVPPGVTNAGIAPPGYRYNFTNPSPVNLMDGDTYYNSTCSDGINYIALDDTDNFGFVNRSPLSISKLTGISPLNGMEINQMTAYGAWGGSWKQDGLICIPSQSGGDVLLMAINWQDNGTNSFRHSYGGLIKSYDHGLTWTNFQHPANAGVSSGDAPTPNTVTMFPTYNASGAFSTLNFVLYASGGSTALTIDNQQTYIYMMASGISNSTNCAPECSQWDGGDKMYLLRVPRSKVENLSEGDYQVYIGGDGSQDSAWTGSLSAGMPIYQETGHVSSTSIQCGIPNVPQCLMIQWYYPIPGRTDVTVWNWLVSDHPWGPWTLIRTDSFAPTGNFNPQILHSSISGGPVVRVISPGDWRTYSGANCGTTPACYYSMWYSDFSLNLPANNLPPPPPPVHAMPFLSPTQITALIDQLWGGTASALSLQQAVAYILYVLHSNGTL